MAKEKIRSTAFRPESLARIEQMSDIIDSYQQQGLTLTARQLYYQCVTRNLISNTPREYQKLTALLTDARYAGLVDWDAIEDRGREPNTPSEWSDIEALVRSALAAYRLPRWDGQERYVELWVEKQALAGVLEPLAREAHATLMVNKGYSSASAMKVSAERIKQKCVLDQELYDDIRERLERTNDLDEDEEERKEAKQYMRLHIEQAIRVPVVLYLGDHDPSGEDMVRDISERLKEFGVMWLQVEKIGLTIAQVKQYNPPPNPAKITDSRAEAYIAKFGPHSWEVDALPPQVLTQLVRAAFAKHVDKKKVAAIKAQEEQDKEALRAAAAKM
jgi:hypothetical protein